jgi:hypothetical protein
MHIEFLVEEPSAEEALNSLVPKMCGAGVSYRIHPFQGKPDLLKRLPNRLRGYKRLLDEGRAPYEKDRFCIVVLVDADSVDASKCKDLKQRLDEEARRARLVCKSDASLGSAFHVLNRIAVEELEAWFFGDMDAVVTAYPAVPRGLEGRRRYRDPDHIAGGTWEALDRVLRRVGYRPGGKRRVARKISTQMDPSRNRSRSFQVFRDAIVGL